jgi:hypothetical protein
MIVFTALARDGATVAQGEATVGRIGLATARSKRAVVLHTWEGPTGAKRTASGTPRFGAQDRPATYLLPSAATFTAVTELSS